jgi:hypothetical protein
VGAVVGFGFCGVLVVELDCAMPVSVIAAAKANAVAVVVMYLFMCWCASV